MARGIAVCLAWKRFRGGRPPRLRELKFARTLACGVLLVALIAGGDASRAFADTSIEFAVKAAFIYKFAPFVDWPANIFSSPDTPFSVCVLGDDGVGALLDQAVAGQRVNGRPIAVHHLQSITRETNCQIVYIAQANAQSVADTLSLLHGAPVLTITDSDRTPGAAGIIGFTIQDGHVRFDVDDAAAAANGLAISSKLLGLAHSVKRRS